ncbi:hypothetical protein [Pseudanabaena sp. Chao 1811]|uniref:hypothetical protein n=1 Tax=Pseudanabaena sp. Chao 1811 TaxID=2963092 RepID=UPI0022F3E939|nr:hypothetical protein [Pseudanabaena sp. Chao 1811]
MIANVSLYRSFYQIVPKLNHKAIALIINASTTQAIVHQQTNNIKQRSPLISTKKRSPKISILPSHKRLSLNKLTTSNSDRL